MAEKEHDQFSRLSLKHRGREHLWQGSGGVVSTGYGSCDNSWFQSATRFQAPLGNLIPRTSPQLLLAPREINGEVKPNDRVLGTLEPGETLEVTSMLRHDGIISIDATHHEPFPLGSVAKIRISDRPLRVISDQV